MTNLFWSFLLGIVLNPQPAVLNVDQVTHLMDVSCLIHAKIEATNPETEKKRHGMIGCSGTFVGDNEVLTAAHCFELPILQAWVRSPTGDSHRVDKVLKISPSQDLCLLHVVGPKHVSAKLALHNPRVGEGVWNVGSPFITEFLLSEGIVSAVGFKVEHYLARYTVTTAMINPGSSGGGAFNEAGELIGVNTMTFGGPFGWAGISMAVSLDDIKGFLR